MWYWIAALAVGGLAWSHFSASSAKAATDLVHQAVAAALVQEHDPIVLTTFAQKLRQAGYDQEAALIDAKAHAFYGARSVSSIAASNVLRNLHL